MKSDGPPRRGDIIIAELRAGEGRTMSKRRPCVVISPDDLNDADFTYLLAPMTTGHHPFRYRVPCRFAGRDGHVVLDQLFTFDARRAGRPIGRLNPAGLRDVLSRLREMFAE